MELKLDFRPDVVIYFRCEPVFGKKDAYNYDASCILGDPAIYYNAGTYIRSLLPKQNCFFFAPRGLGVYQIVNGSMPN